MMERRNESYVELPPFNVLSCFLVCNDHHELGDLAAGHPPVQLRHDLFDVSFDLVV